MRDLKFIGKAIIVVGLAAVSAYLDANGQSGDGWAIIAVLVLCFALRKEDESYLQRHVKSGEPITIDSKFISRNPATALILKDGTKVSVQASRNNYCTPRNDTGPYTRFEVGDVDGTFNPPESWNEWADGPDSWVYGYVPFLELMMVIALHGGIDAEATERHTAQVRASKRQR